MLETKHHFRPRSRGGNNGPENLRSIPERTRHHPYHYLFTNLRPHEVALLFFFAWQTQSVPLNKDHFNPENFAAHLRAWQHLFGAQATKDSAIEVLQREFAVTKEDKRLMDLAMRLCTKAWDLDLADTFVGAKACSLKDRGKWTDKDFMLLFGKLDPHAAILLTVLSWHTICPHQEFQSPETFQGKTPRKSMQQRLVVWNKLFDRDVPSIWVAQTIKREYASEYGSREDYLASQALMLCRALVDLLPSSSAKIRETRYH